MEKSERALANALMIKIIKKHWKKMLPVIVIITYFGYQVSRIPEPDVRLFLFAITTFVGIAITLLLCQEKKK